MHASTAERIADTAALSRDSIVFEIGPGTGMLTRPLLARAGRVIALEADGELFQKLSETFAAEIASGRLELIHGDIRTFSPDTLPKGYVLVANIPYYLTGEIFRTFLSAQHQPASMTLLVQKEVAERIAREKKGNLLALSVRAYGAPHYAFTVPRGAFVPAPKVDSAVLHIDHISRAHFSSPAHEARFFELLHAGFAHKRKRLISNLADCIPTGLQKLFVAEGLSENVRAEDVSLSSWLALATKL